MKSVVVKLATLKEEKCFNAEFFTKDTAEQDNIMKNAAKDIRAARNRFKKALKEKRDINKKYEQLKREGKLKELG